MPAGGKFGAGSYRYLPARSVFIQIIKSLNHTDRKHT